LVLGGGGAAGHAWLIGVVAGLSDAGLDVADVDLIIGTSAGSTAATMITSAASTDLLADIVAEVPQERTERAGTVPGSPATSHLETTGAIIAAAHDPGEMRRSLGAWALERSASDSSGQARWRETVAGRLRSHVWPQQRMLITAVDARTGEPVVFDRHSGVDLVDAVAASCASRFAYGIGDQWYIDGGYRSNADNTDLAGGHARVLVLSPFGGRSRTPVAWGLHLATQVDELRAHGSEVETIFPDDDARTAFGDNMMDLSTRPPAARAGYSQGRARAEQLLELWR
jgi:NTE family protein